MVQLRLVISRPSTVVAAEAVPPILANCAQPDNSLAALNVSCPPRESRVRHASRPAESSYFVIDTEFVEPPTILWLRRSGTWEWHESSLSLLYPR